MLASAHIQRNVGAFLRSDNDSGGLHPDSLAWLLLLVLFHQFQDSHRRVISIKNFPARHSTPHLLIYWIQGLGHRFTSFRHHRFRQRRSAITLQCGAPIVWRRQPTFDDRHRCVRRLVISFRTHSFGQRRFIFLPAIIAAHHFLLVDRDRDRRLPCTFR